LTRYKTESLLIQSPIVKSINIHYYIFMIMEINKKLEMT